MTRCFAPLVAVVTGAALCVLTGCAAPTGAGDELGLGGEEWQVIALHTDPDMPGGLPADAAGKASVSFGASSLKGMTGCAPFHALYSAEAADSEGAPGTAGTLRVEKIDVADPGECSGGSRYVHDELLALLTPGATFTVRHLTAKEVLLTKKDAGIDPPSFRVMAL